MADLTPATPPEINIVNAYGDGGFRIGGEAYRGSVVVLPTSVTAWTATDAAGITAESLAVVIDAEPKVELLLVGCGVRLLPLPPELRRRLRDAGIGVEPMDTGAACRTYNVLVAEGRRVAAALIAIG